MTTASKVFPLSDEKVYLKGCCPVMKSQLSYDCDQHGASCPDVVITKNARGDYFLNSKNATYTAKFCPWCGSNLK